MAALGKEEKGTTTTTTAVGGEVLMPFYQRASEAEVRLSKLEAALATNNGAGDDQLLKKITQLESKLEAATSELASEREKVQMLVTENSKLRYRIDHLLRAIRDGDARLASLTGGLEEKANTTSKMGNLQL